MSHSTRGKLDDNHSRRLDILRFPLIVGVVFIHAYAMPPLNADAVRTVDWQVVDFVRNIVSQGIARVAVPTLFLISGYLIAITDLGTLDSYLSKLLSRVKTLLVPFLFWNLFTLAVVALVMSLPLPQKYFSGSGAWISDLSLKSCVSAVLGLGRDPISYPFWFIRDLMILIIVAPIIRAVTCALPKMVFTALIASWLFDLMPKTVPSPEALLFFSIGVNVSSRGASLFSFDRFAIIILALYVPLLIADALLYGRLGQPFLHHVAVALGMPVILRASCAAVKGSNWSNTVTKLSGASFFVFAAHEPLFTVLKKLAFTVLHPTSTGALLTIYLFLPTFLIILLVAGYVSLSRFLPRSLAYVTGGR